MKPLIDRLSTVPREFLSHVGTIIGKIVMLMEDVTATRSPQQQDINPQPKSQTAAKRRGHK